MRYTVVITDQAERDVDDIASFIGAREKKKAARWFEQLLEAMASLEDMPRRCKAAPESDCFEIELRQLNYGKYRILFTIEANQVRVLHVRHSARRPVKSDDLDDV